MTEEEKWSFFCSGFIKGDHWRLNKMISGSRVKCQKSWREMWCCNQALMWNNAVCCYINSFTKVSSPPHFFYKKTQCFNPPPPHSNSSFYSLLLSIAAVWAFEGNWKWKKAFFLTSWSETFYNEGVKIKSPLKSFYKRGINTLGCNVHLSRKWPLVVHFQVITPI